MNQTKIYVGNLSYQSNEDDLKGLFSQYGEIDEIRVITDRNTGRSRGFAFVTFENSEGAQSALAANGTDFQERRIKVSLANDSRGGGGGGNRRSGGGGGNRGGYR